MIRLKEQIGLPLLFAFTAKGICLIDISILYSFFMFALKLVGSIKYGGVYQDTYRHEVIYIYEACTCMFMHLYDCAGQ